MKLEINYFKTKYDIFFSDSTHYLLAMEFSSCAAGDGQSDGEEDSPSTPVSPTSRQLYQKKYRANMTDEQKANHNLKNATANMSEARRNKKHGTDQVDNMSEARSNKRREDNQVDNMSEARSKRKNEKRD